MSTAMLSFKLGPVQPFIEAARTLRDLWSGSYLLSWLTAHGMKPVIEKYGYDSFVTPNVTAENPLIHAVMSKTPKKDEASTLACLPHTFAAKVTLAGETEEARTTEAKALADTITDAVRTEWNNIAEAVRAELPQPMWPFIDGEEGRATPSANWKAQIETHFEIVVVVRPNSGPAPEAQEWRELTELREMARSVRHVPAYSPKPDEKGRFPVKCSQLGSYEQMGPADFDKAREYWAGLTSKGNKAGESWDGRHGTRLQSSDKLCAVALVKRFMWPFYFATSAKRPRLDIDVRDLRLTDTATMAARKWLGEGEVKIDPKFEWTESKQKYWSGQWLHWSAPKEDDDAICPHDGENSLWDRIQRKKRAQGKPPTYFALMHLDGDNMGGLFKGNRSDIIEATTKLTKFSEGVQAIVKQYQGELIYAGGDDVLAFLPTETVIECARELHDRFIEKLPGATLSGGIAVVHYKEDLRFALGQVRAAEKAAKKISRAKPIGDEPPRKDALALAICKRSGEHGTVVMGWTEAASLQKLIVDFKGDAGRKIPPVSDRWAYKLRAELETLKGLPLEAGKAETLRLVGRGENATDQFKAVIASLFEAYQSQMQHKSRNWADADVLTGFVALCQSASFLARGKE